MQTNHSNFPGIRSPDSHAAAIAGVSVALYFLLNGVSGVTMWSTMGGGFWGICSGVIIFTVFSGTAYTSSKTLRGDSRRLRHLYAMLVLATTFSVDFVALKHELSNGAMRSFAAVEVAGAAQTAAAATAGASTSATDGIRACRKSYPRPVRDAKARNSCAAPYELALKSQASTAPAKAATADDVGEVKNWQFLADWFGTTPEKALNWYVLYAIGVLGLCAVFAMTYRAQDEFADGWGWHNMGDFVDVEPTPAPALLGGGQPAEALTAQLKQKLRPAAEAIAMEYGRAQHGSNLANDAIADYLGKMSKRPATGDSNTGHSNTGDSITVASKGTPETPINAESYHVAASALVGASVECPHCGKRFTKRNAQHLFCSNGRNKRADGVSCSDEYWNARDPSRLAAMKAKSRSK